MGWTWTCFGGRKERLRRLDSDGRVRHKSRLCVLVRQERLDNDSQTSTPPKPHSLAAQIRPKSPARDSSAYDEPFQPKQVVCGSLHGSKLFRRKPVRRANSLGSTSFENGAKKSCDKKSAAKTPEESQPEVLVDRLQEEVEALRKRLAEEEAEARKLRNEVVYLRSCGVLQSPERVSCSSIERDSASAGSFKDDRAQRQWQSWLGLTLSPASRIKLEDQLRLMAAEEMSKNPGKGLTNGQKALIVASRLWHYQADDSLHPSQVKFEHRDSYSSDTSSRLGSSLTQNQGLDELLPEKNVLPEGSRSRQLSKEAPLPEFEEEEESTLHVASFRDSLDLKFPPGSNIVQEINSKTLPSAYESENFSFHPSSEKPVIKDVTVIQRATSFPSAVKLSENDNVQVGEDFDKCPTEEQVKFESPRRSSSLPNPGAAVPTSDEARRFIDLRYQELEEKLSKSPKRLSLSSPTATPDRSPPHPFCEPLQLDDFASLHEDSLQASSPDDKRFPRNKTAPDSIDVISDEDSPSTPVMSKPFFSARNGRLWQPLSPVKEFDSGLSSVPSSEKDTSSVFSSQKNPSDQVDDGGLSSDSWTSQTNLSFRNPVSGNEPDAHDEASSTTDSSDGAGDVHDDDLFTLSPRRLNRHYDPWDDDHNVQTDGIHSAKVDSSVDSGTTSDWNTSEDSDFDILPIQCQSPDLSPKPLRSKFSKDNSELKKMEEYPRDKYLKEMGLKVDEMVGSSESVLSTEPLSAQKENQKSTESLSAPGVGHPAIPIGPPQDILPLSKTSSANDLTVSHDSAHPVLASIENLPKWIEYQGIYVSPVNKENTQVASQLVKKEETVQVQRDVVIGEIDVCEQSNSACTPPTSVAEIHRKDVVCAKIQSLEEPELDDTYQVQVEKGKPFYFEISQNQGNELMFQNKDEETHRNQAVDDKNHRYSAETDCQSNLSEGETVPVSMVEILLTPTRQDEGNYRSPQSVGINVESLQLDAYSSTEHRQPTGSGFGDNVHSSKMHAGESGVDNPADFAEEFDYKNAQAPVFNQGGLAALNPQVTNTELVDAEEETDDNADRAYLTVPRHRHSVSDGSVGEAESLRESCSSNVVQSPGVSKGFEVLTSFSRDIGETDYSYGSSLISTPSLLERHCQTSFRTLMETSDPTIEDEENNSDSPASPARGLLNISPDDRPILGTVATWWADESLSKSRRWWDGQGIPNSTSKYKEVKFQPSDSPICNPKHSSK